MGSYLMRTLNLSWSDDNDSEEMSDQLVQAGLMNSEQSALINTLISQRQAVIDGDLKVVVYIVVNHLDEIIEAGRTLLNHAPDIPGEPSTGLHPLIVKYRNVLLTLAACHGLTNLRVYGSMARGDADEYSNVDLLACDPPEAGCLQLIHMMSDVEQLLQRPVDLYTDGDLLAEQRERILQEAIPL